MITARNNAVLDANISRRWVKRLEETGSTLISGIMDDADTIKQLWEHEVEQLAIMILR